MEVSIRTKARAPSSYRASRHSYGDSLSEHDMDFDWADETLHASYGKRWLKELLAARGQDLSAYEEVRKHCEKLVRPTF
jgi:hypothetical protein